MEKIANIYNMIEQKEHRSNQFVYWIIIASLGGISVGAALVSLVHYWK